MKYFIVAMLFAMPAYAGQWTINDQNAYVRSDVYQAQQQQDRDQQFQQQVRDSQPKQTVCQQAGQTTTCTTN